MNMQSSNTKKIIIICALVAVLGLAIYFLFFRDTSTTTVTFDQFGNPVQAQVIGSDLIELLGRLQSVTLDQTFLSSAAFINLTNFGIILPNETPGRTNPFEPLAGYYQSAGVSNGISQKAK